MIESFLWGRSLTAAVMIKEGISLMYGFSYHLDPKTTAVGERDAALAGIIRDVQSFWDTMDFDTLNAMAEDKMYQKLDGIIMGNQTSKIGLAQLKNYFLYITPEMLL